MKASTAIVTTDSFSRLQQLADSSQDLGNILVLLDFAKVMCTHKDPWMLGHKKERQAVNSIKTFAKASSALAQQVGPEKHKKLLGIFQKARRYRLIDNTLPSVISALQQRSAKIIALTSFKAAGDAGTKNQRFAALQKQGIDFSAAFPNHKELILKKLEKHGKFPTFFKGILSNAGIFSKGDVLRVFLNTIGWHPSKVIFYDDRLDNLASVQQVLASLGIDFEGYLYTGFNKLPAYFDKKIAELQVNHLIKHERWISGHKAKRLLKR